MKRQVLEPDAASDRLFDGLARELKLSLTYIARQSEYLANKSASQPAGDIENAAQEALTLIDNYLLCAQMEYGQQLLPLEPVGIGSVLYDTAHELDVLAKSSGYKIEVTVSNLRPAMAHKKALQATIQTLAQMIMTNNSPTKKSNKIHLMADKRRSGDYITGVFGGVPFNQTDVLRARQLAGKSHMALANQAFGSGINLAIADSLSRSMGAVLRSVKHNSMNGLGVYLLKSEQLNLV